MKLTTALLIVTAFFAGTLIDHDIVYADSMIGHQLNDFCPTGYNAQPISFIHDEEGQRIEWIYGCTQNGNWTQPINP